jgi:hypothetical protein
MIKEFEIEHNGKSIALYKVFNFKWWVVRIPEHNFRYMSCEELEAALRFTAKSLNWHECATKLSALFRSYHTRKRVYPHILERRKAAIRI